MDEITPEVTVDTTIVQPVVEQPAQLKKVGWEVQKDFSEGKLRIRMKNEKGQIIDKASIDINATVEDIKARLLARNYDVSNFNPIL